MVAAAGTLLIPSGPLEDQNRRHLHVVCTDPCAAGNQIIVSITTWTNDLCDDACILEAHEHECLRHKSYVLYRKARIEAASSGADRRRRGEGRFVVNSASLARRVAVEGLALIQTPLQFIASDLSQGKLTTVLEQWTPTPMTGLFLYYPSRRHMRPALKAFVDFLRDEHHGASQEASQ